MATDSVIDITATISGTRAPYGITLTGKQVDENGSITVNAAQCGYKIRFTVDEASDGWTFPAGALSAPGMGHYFNGIWIQTADPTNQFSEPDRSPDGGIVSFVDLNAGDGGTDADPIVYTFKVYLVYADGETASTDPAIKNQN